MSIRRRLRALRRPAPIALVALAAALCAASANARVAPAPGPASAPLLTGAHTVHLHLVRPKAHRRSRHARRGRSPVVTTQPQSTLVAPGGYARFNAVATGRPKPKARWQISVNGGQKWRNIPGARGTALSFMALAGQNGNEFRAVFANKHGHVATAAAVLQVVAGESAPLIVSQPTDQTAAAGATVTFSATASGQPAPTVQWEISDNGGGSWSDVAGATQSTLAFTASSILNGDQFRAAFTNALGSALSSVATLTVTGQVAGPPAVTEQPQSASVTAGQTVTFTSAASGSPAPSVQWQVSTDHGTSWQPISGATSNMLSFSATAQDNLYEYEAVFTSSGGSATSNPAILAVNYSLAQNWSGYAAIGTTYSAVTASWTVPTMTCPSGQTNTFSSQWVGLDGINDGSVEQDGTYANCNGTSASYGAWYEMYGDSAVNNGDEVALTAGCTGVTACTVAQGDTITASVSVDSSGNWTLSLSDATAPDVWSFSTTIAWATPQRNSAEWIVERPQYCDTFNNCSLTQLADFGTVQFTNATATPSGSGAESIKALGGQPIEMVSSASDSTLLASPSALSASGEIFTDTWFATG
jgi:hypothetical protein